MSLPARAATPVRNKDRGLPGNGGRYASAERGKPNLTLAPEPVVTDADGFPDLASYERAWPNPHQRMDRLNEAYYAIAADPASVGFARERAAREAVRITASTNGRLVSLPEDDGEAESYVRDALGSDPKVAAALDRVGSLADYEARSFGARVAGALYDIEILDREERLASAASAAGSPVWALYPRSRFDEWPSWLPQAAPPEEPEGPLVTW